MEARGRKRSGGEPLQTKVRYMAGSLKMDNPSMADGWLAFQTVRIRERVVGTSCSRIGNICPIVSAEELARRFCRTAQNEDKRLHSRNERHNFDMLRHM